MKKPKQKLNTQETFPQYLARVAGDFRDLHKNHASPTAADLDKAAQRIEELEAALDGLAVAANWALTLVPAGPRRNQGEMRLGKAYSMLGEKKRFLHLYY